MDKWSVPRSGWYEEEMPRAWKPNPTSTADDVARF
jgi:hypothetical protein